MIFLFNETKEQKRVIIRNEIPKYCKIGEDYYRVQETDCGTVVGYNYPVLKVPDNAEIILCPDEINR